MPFFVQLQPNRHDIIVYYGHEFAHGQFSLMSHKYRRDALYFFSLSLSSSMSDFRDDLQPCEGMHPGTFSAGRFKPTAAEGVRLEAFLQI
jgi:hypothetical protein